MVADCQVSRVGLRRLLGRLAGIDLQAGGGETAIADQLAEMRRYLLELSLEVRRLSLRDELEGLCDAEPQLRSLYRALQAQEVDGATAVALVHEVARDRSRDDLADYASVRAMALASLCRLIPCTGPLRPVQGGGRVLFLVGPTGVGKTTTLAKLAAQLAIVERQHVLLVNADNYRIGAETQLQTYADIMGLPFAVVRSPAELAETAVRYARTDLILVDTPGHSQRNSAGLAETRALIDAVPDARRQVYLAVSATTRLHELLDVEAAFGSLEATTLVATKVDEALHYGPLVSLVAKRKRALAYLTTGQSVPEDLEVATPLRLAELTLRGY